MKRCTICGKEHDNGCDKSEWDGILNVKFNITAPMHSTEISKIEEESIKEEERQHIAKKRGRPRHNG